MQSEHGIGVEVRATTNALASDLRQAEALMKTEAKRIERAALVQLRVDPAAVQAAENRRRMTMMMTQDLGERIIQPARAVDMIIPPDTKQVMERVGREHGDHYGRGFVHTAHMQMRHFRQALHVATGAFIVEGLGEIGIAISRLLKGNFASALESFERVPILGQLTRLGHELHDEFFEGADAIKEAGKELAASMREAAREFARTMQSSVVTGIEKVNSLKEELALLLERDPNKRARLELEQERARRKRAIDEEQDRRERDASAAKSKIFNAPATLPKGLDLDPSQEARFKASPTAETLRAILVERQQALQAALRIADERYRAALRSTDPNDASFVTGAAKDVVRIEDELKALEEVLFDLQSTLQSAEKNQANEAQAAKESADAQKALVDQIFNAKLERTTATPIIDTIQTILGGFKVGQSGAKPSSESEQQKQTRELVSINRSLKNAAVIPLEAFA